MKIIKMPKGELDSQTLQSFKKMKLNSVYMTLIAIALGIAFVYVPPKHQKLVVAGIGVGMSALTRLNFILGGKGELERKLLGDVETLENSPGPDPGNGRVIASMEQAEVDQINQSLERVQINGYVPKV